MTTSSALVLRSPAEAEVRDRAATDEAVEEIARVRDYFGRSDREEPGPQGYLVERLPPHTTSRAHFHPCDQFQVFLPAEDAWYQRTPIDRVLVQYADHDVTYGPFGSGEHPLAWFTLRAAATTAIGFMPEARERRAPGPARRNLRLALDPADEPDAGPGQAEVLVPPHPDGLAVHRVRAGPGSEVRVDGGGPGGAFVCVLDGVLAQAGARFGPRSLGWTEPRAGALTLATPDDEGIDALVLRFPGRAPCDP